MDAYQIRFAKSLCDILENRVSELTALLVSTPAPDHSAYSERVGHIKGLKSALQEARDLEERMGKPEAKKEQGATNRRGYED